jgi:flagellar motor switch protein FliN
MNADVSVPAGNEGVTGSESEAEARAALAAPLPGMIGSSSPSHPLTSGSGPEGRSVGSASPLQSQTPDFLLDVRLTVSVEVGRAQMPVRQVMELGPGSIVELQRGASEPVDVFANGRCIGRGEIVVVGEQFGVRITELAQGSKS